MWCHPLHGNRWAHPAYFQGMSMFLRCPWRPGLRAGGEGSQALQGCGQLCPGSWAMGYLGARHYPQAGLLAECLSTWFDCRERPLSVGATGPGLSSRVSVSRSCMVEESGTLESQLEATKVSVPRAQQLRG